MTLAAAQPGLSGGNPLVVDMSTGAVTSGAFTFSENSLAAGDIVTGLIVSNGGEVKVLTGGNYTMAGSFIGTGPASGDAGNLTIRAGGTLSLGASTLIAALGGAGGADGQVNLTAGTTFVKTLDMRGGEFNLTGDTIDLPDFITASELITITVTDGGSLINNDRSIATTVISDTSILIQADNPGGDDEMTLSGTGNFTPGSDQFVEITAPTRLHFADGMDWVLINGSAVVLTPELRGANNGSANLQTLDADGCICVQEETGSTIRFRSEDGSSPTTIMLNAPSAAISVEGAGEEMILDAGVTLSSSGTWDIGVNEDAVLRLDGLIQSSAQSIDIRNDSDGMGLRGTGALTPGGGNPVNIISLGNLVLFDGLDITVTSGGLVVDGTTILGPDGGLARITAPGTIELGSCDCLRVAPLTAGQQTTIELDTGALNIIADGFTLDQGAMLTTPGDLFAQVSGAGQFVNNGILRTTSSNNAIISSQSGDALEIAGTGEFRLDAAIPPFLVFMSNSEISFQGANSVRTANALTLAPVFIGAPQISGIAGGGGLTTDGGSISISNTDGSDAIEFNGGTLNFNGGPLYVQNNTVSLRSATTLASNNLIGIYLPDTMGPAVFSNEGTLRSTAAGTNIYIIGDSGYAIAGDGAINSSGGSIGLTAGETVTVGTGAAMTQDFSGSGAVYFVASVVELNDALLRSATATTFGFTTGTGQDLTIAVAGASTVDTSQGFVYMQPGTVTQSIFLDAGAPGAELTLNTHSAFGVGLRTAPPGASNLDPSLVLRSDGRITCQGNCNGFPLLAAPALAADLLSLSVAGGKPAVSAASLLSGISAGLAVVSTVTGLDSLPSSTSELAVSARQPRSRSGQAARSPVVRAADDIDDQESARLTALGVRIGNGPYGRNLALEGGSVLFAPVEAVTVDAGSAELAIEAGAAVFVCRRDDALAVYNLHDRHRDGVRALIGTASIVVRPGQCLIVSADKRAAPPAGWRLPLRRLQVLESRAGGGLALAEFSLASAMLRIPQLVDLFRSTARDDRRLSASLIKMAAIQHQLGAGHGPFRER